MWNGDRASTTRAEEAAESLHRVRSNRGACWLLPAGDTGDRRKPAMSSSDQAKPLRMWVTECMFKKNSFPSLGAFGSTSGLVVIMTVSTWEQLCREIPELATRH